MRNIIHAFALLGIITFITCVMCRAQKLPNHKLTPGVVDQSLEADLSRKSRIIDGVEHNICATDFVTPPFRVATKSQKTKTQVCQLYGITKDCPGPQWELDDIIPVELGGRNVADNLWPQPIHEARIKDHQVEDRLGGPHGLVCKGRFTLKEAQACVNDDWVQCMKRLGRIAK